MSTSMINELIVNTVNKNIRTAPLYLDLNKTFRIGDILINTEDEDTPHMISQIGGGMVNLICLKTGNRYGEPTSVENSNSITIQEITEITCDDENHISWAYIDNSEPINIWKEAIIDKLVIYGIYNKQHEEDPIKAINAIIDWEVDVALDPRVSKFAEELQNQGFIKARQLIMEQIQNMKP